MNKSIHIITQQSPLAASVCLYDKLEKYRTDFNMVFINAWSDSVVRFVCTGRYISMSNKSIDRLALLHRLRLIV